MRSDERLLRTLAVLNSRDLRHDFKLDKVIHSMTNYDESSLIALDLSS